MVVDHMGGHYCICFPGYKMHPKYLELVKEPKLRLALAKFCNTADAKGTTNIVNVRMPNSVLFACYSILILVF